MATETYPTQAELLNRGIKTVTIRATRGYEPKGFVVYGWCEPARQVFLGGFQTLEEARTVFPFADVVDAG